MAHLALWGGCKMGDVLTIGLTGASRAVTIQSVMKMRCESSSRKIGQVLSLCAFSVAALSSCNQEDAEPAPSPAENATEAATAAQQEAPAATNTENKENAPKEEANIYRQIAQYVALNIAPALANPNSQITPQVKELLSLMSSMYDKETESGATPAELASLAFVIAEMRKSYGAWPAALEEYEKVLKHVAEMGAEEQQQIGTQALLSSVRLSQTACYIQTGNREKAKESLDNRLQLAEELAQQLPELKEGESKQISNEEFATYARIAQILLSSLRLEAEFMSTTDPEDAADYYEQTIVRAKKLLWCKHALVVQEYMDLLISAVNHEIRCNRHQQATTHLDELITIYENSAKQAEGKANIQAAINKKIEEFKTIRSQIQSGNTESIGEIPTDETAVPTEPEQPAN